MIENERKFLIAIQGNLPPCQEWHIVQTYLTPTAEGHERRLRQRKEGTSYTFLLTEKGPRRGSQREENEREISLEEYQALLQEADPSRRPIRKLRRRLRWQGHMLEIDTFLEPTLEHPLLEIELSGPMQSPLTLPPFIEVLEEVTYNPAYYNSALAQRRP